VIFDRANGGLFISEDGGRAWRQSMTGMGVRDVYSLYQPESNPATIYAGTNDGLFRSDDRGHTWTQVKKGPAGRTQLRAGTKSRTQPAAGKEALVDLQNQVFAIMPFTPSEPGPSAPASPSAPAASSRGGDSTASRQSKTNWMVASTWNGLFITEDEKKGWREIKLASGAGEKTVAQIKVNAIVTAHKLPGAIFIGTNDGLFISRDNGAIAQRMALPEEARLINSVACDPRNPDAIYVGSATGFFRSMDGGRTWESRGGGMPQGGNVSAIVVSSANSDELYLSDESRGALYHSVDKGLNWEKVDISQAPSLKLWSLASDQFDPKKIYAGSYSGGVYVINRK